MKKTLLLVLLIAPFFSYSQSCKVIYKLNPTEFFESTKELRKVQNYDEIIRMINDSIKKDSSEIWPYYQLACTYSIKGDTTVPFHYLYKYIDLKEFSDDILSDSDFDKLHSTYAWKCLKDTMTKVYLSKYPNITNPDLSIKLWECGIYDQMYRTLGRNQKRLITEFDTVVLQKMDDSFIDSLESQADFVYGLLNKGIIPTYSMVGVEASNTFLLIFKHMYRKDLSKKKLKLLYKAAINREISIEHYIIVHDFSLIQKGKKQLYGTQVGQIIEYDKKGDRVYGKGFFSPIEDEKNVNKRRLQLGLPTIEEYAKKINIDYKYDAEYDKLSADKAYKKLREINAEAIKQLKKEIEEKDNNTENK
ncbi:MAG: DUF6624 domain-containing protein [Bacteroidales bacterium]